jgi:uncharacterized protein (TIGR02246 family)
MKYSRLLTLFTVSLATFTINAQTQTGPASRNPTVEHHTNDNEAEIQQLYDRWAKAFRAKDIDAIMSVYAPAEALVAYDIVPPLQYLGNAAYRKNYEAFLALYDGPINVEIRDLRIFAGDDVAFVHCLELMGGTLKSGQKSEIWVRATSGLRKLKGKWLIVHDHISVPADLDSGKAVLDLRP